MGTAPEPDRPVDPQTAGRCPTCGRPRMPAFRPFCSARCRDVDLARWLRGDYAVPAQEVEADDEADR